LARARDALQLLVAVHVPDLDLAERNAALVEMIARALAGLLAHRRGVERDRVVLHRELQIVGILLAAVGGSGARGHAAGALLLHALRRSRRRRVGDVDAAVLIGPAIHLLRAHRRD